MFTALCPLLPLHEYLSRPVAHIRAMLYLSDLYVLLLFLPQLPLLPHSFDEAHLILQELVELSMLNGLVVLASGELWAENAVFDLFLGLFLPHLSDFFFFLLDKLVHLGVEFVLRTRRLNETIH